MRRLSSAALRPRDAAERIRKNRGAGVESSRSLSRRPEKLPSGLRVETFSSAIANHLSGRNLLRRSIESPTALTLAGRSESRIEFPKSRRNPAPEKTIGESVPPEKSAATPTSTRAAPASFL